MITKERSGAERLADTFFPSFTPEWERLVGILEAKDNYPELRETIESLREEIREREVYIREIEG